MRPRHWQNPFKVQLLVGEHVGNAWIRIDRNTPFAVWANLRVGWSPNQDKVEMFVFLFGRSHERKSAYANGFARFLTESGIPASTFCPRLTDFAPLPLEWYQPRQLREPR